PRNADARRMQRLIEERTIKGALPRLRAAKPMSLDLRDVPVRSVFDVIGRTANYNFVFDRDVRPDLRTSVTVRDLPVEDLIRLVLTTNQLESRVINESTALIYPDTPAMVRLAERLIAAQDLADPEVMLEVEVLEVGSNRLVELGLRFPDSLA